MTKVVLLLIIVIVLVPYNNANSYDSTTIMRSTSNIFSYIYNFITSTIFSNTTRLDKTDYNRQLRGGIIIIIIFKIITTIIIIRHHPLLLLLLLSVIIIIIFSRFIE